MRKLVRTVSAYLVTTNKVLLIFHPKFDKWLPAGGHVEEGECSWAALQRELTEEIGMAPLDGDKVLDDIATSYPPPNIVQVESVGDFYAENNIYIIGVSEEFPINSPENLTAKWMTSQEVADLPKDKVFLSTKIHLDWIFHNKEM